MTARVDIESVRTHAIAVMKLLVEAAKSAYKLRMLSMTAEEKRRYFNMEISLMNQCYDIKDELMGWVLTENDLRGIDM